MQVPEDLLYTEEHEWIRQVDGENVIRVGITDYAQDQLGDVVYVELPEVGRQVAKEDMMVEVESTKSVGEVYAPLAGQVRAVNQAVADNPELVNQSPYEEAWLVEIALEDPLETAELLTAESYRNLTE